MPKKKQDLEQAEQVQVTEDGDTGVQAPPKAKKPVTRKKATAPKTDDASDPAQNAQEKSEHEAPQTQEPASEAKPTARKKSTGTKKTPAKKKSEPQEQVSKEAEAPQAAQEEVEAQTPATPLLGAPNDKLPVKTQPQRGVEVAVPPVNLAMLGTERRNFWGRLFLLLAVGVVLALSIVIFVYRPTVYSARTHSIRFLYNASQNTTQVLYDGELCDTTLAGELTQSMYDTSGSICAATVGGKLYLVQGDEIEEISPTVQDFLLAQTGRALVYRNAENQLHYVNLLGKSERYTVSRDSRDGRYALSPNGEALFYTYVETKAEDELKTHAAVFLLSGEKPFFPRTTGIIPVAISDSCEHIFYFDEAGDLYYMNEDSEISLCRRNEGGMEILFDREFEEVLIKDAKGIMLWQDGEETMIPQLKGAENLTLLPNHRADCRVLPAGTQWLVHSFDENYYLKKGGDADGTRLAYLDGDELTEVAFLSETESAPVVTDKGVYYLERVEAQDGVRKHLYFCPDGKTVAERLSWDVEDYCVNSDGSRILHKDHQGWLYAARVSNGHLDSVFISDYVDGKLHHASATDMFYYYVGDNLYASDNGVKPEQTLSAELDGFVLDAHTAFFFDAQEDGTYTVYTKHRNRKKLLQVASGIVDID